MREFYFWEDRLKGYSSLIKIRLFGIAIAVIFWNDCKSHISINYVFIFAMCVWIFYINLKKGDIFYVKKLREVSYCNILNTTLLNFKDILTNKILVYLIVFSLCCSTFIKWFFINEFFIENFDFRFIKKY